MVSTFIDMNEGSTAAHNMYLKVLCELGILGFIPFIFIKDILNNIISNNRNYIIDIYFLFINGFFFTW
jgi:O-antigen ligase